MNRKTYPWILIDKANMSTFRHRFHNAQAIAFSMMKSGTIQFRDFSEFIVIKNEKQIVDLESAMAGVGGEYTHILHKVVQILENA